jgi:hypothetical protein
MKMASINVFVNFITIILGFLPSLIVRKSFLDSLGNEILGLSSLYINVIGVLSIIELGIGSAIIFSLYKPFAENNKKKVKGYLNYYSKFYRIVGVIIFATGLLLTPFLHLFTNNQVNLLDAKLYFVLFLVDTLISYLFSYKLCILIVAQEGYRVTIGATISKLIIGLLQFSLLKTFPNFYGYILIQIIVNLLYFTFMSVYIDRKYKWIRNTIGEITYEEKNALIKNIKALFFHKLGGILVLGTDNIIISYFINLSVVGKFSSFYLVLGAAQTIISTSLSGVTASIGNLLVERNSEIGFKVHKRLFFLSFWLVSFVTILLFNTLEQFVMLWLGESQIIDSLTINLLLMNFYFILMRGSVERFKESGGIYQQDKFAPFFEVLINLISSITLVNIIGLPGVFLGTLISNLLVVFWIKPKMVYKYIFNKSLKEYFKMYFKYLIIGFIPLLVTHIATITIKESINLLSFGVNCFMNFLLINLIYYIVFRKNQEFLYFKELILNFNKKFRMVIANSMSSNGFK